MNSLVGGKRRQRCWLPCHVARCVRMQGPAVESICSLTSLAYSASISSSMGCADFPSFAELLHTVHLSTVFFFVATSSRALFSSNFCPWIVFEFYNNRQV